jgi:hypothetical protein
MCRRYPVDNYTLFGGRKNPSYVKGCGFNKDLHVGLSLEEIKMVPLSADER